MRNIVLVSLLVSALSGCGFPSGAPLQSRIVSEATAETPTYAVEAVTRANLPKLSAWPATGWAGHYVWLQPGGGGATTTIRPGDSLNLTIWDNEENSLLATAGTKSTAMQGLLVSPHGSVFLPYVGEVSVNGLSPDAARSRIQQQLERIAPSAQVQLSVAPGLINSVDLVGGVAKPGPVELPSRDFTILSLLARGGGIAPALENPLVRLIRAGKTYEIRADDLMADASRNIVMRGGDKVIIAPDERFFIAMGTTQSEKLVYFDREHITAMEAVSMLGGLNDARADLKGLVILREYPAQAVRADGVAGPKMTQVVFTLDLTDTDGLFAAKSFEVHPRDLVIGTESPMLGMSNLLSIVTAGLTAYAKL